MKKHAHTQHTHTQTQTHQQTLKHKRTNKHTNAPTNAHKQGGARRRRLQVCRRHADDHDEPPQGAHHGALVREPSVAMGGVRCSVLLSSFPVRWPLDRTHKHTHKQQTNKRAACRRSSTSARASPRRASARTTCWRSCARRGGTWCVAVLRFVRAAVASDADTPQTAPNPQTNPFPCHSRQQHNKTNKQINKKQKNRPLSATTRGCSSRRPRLTPPRCRTRRSTSRTCTALTTASPRWELHFVVVWLAAERPIALERVRRPTTPPNRPITTTTQTKNTSTCRACSPRRRPTGSC